MIKNTYRAVLIAGFSLLAAGCGALVELPNSGSAPQLYNLTAIDTLSSSGSDQMLMIEDPTSAGGLDVSHIARRPSTNELQYFSGVRWNARLANMVQSVLVESFENAGQQVSMGRGGAVMPSKFELQVELRDFQAEYFDGSNTPTIHIRLAVKLVLLSPLTAVGNTIVDVREDAFDARMPSIIAAFDRANHEAMARTISWATPLVSFAD